MEDGSNIGELTVSGEDIAAARHPETVLYDYTVYYLTAEDIPTDEDEPGYYTSLQFECQAESEEHAVKQLRDAEPEADITSVEKTEFIQQSKTVKIL